MCTDRNKEQLARGRSKLTGQKPPLLPKQVWAIRTRLQLANRVRDLTLFNVAIDSKLRGCDVVRLMILGHRAEWALYRASDGAPAKNGPAGQV